MKKSRFSTEQIKDVVRQKRAGTNMLDLCCKYRVTSVTIYKWCKRYREFYENGDTNPVDPMLQ